MRSLVQVQSGAPKYNGNRIIRLEVLGVVIKDKHLCEDDNTRQLIGIKVIGFLVLHDGLDVRETIPN